MLILVRPFSPLAIRGFDSYGGGAFGASRDGGKRVHHGLDLIAKAGTIVKSTCKGVVTKIGWPYADDLSYYYIEITTPEGYQVRHFYVLPGVRLQEPVEAGETHLGIVQMLGLRYPKITNHIHLEIKNKGEYIDPTPYLLDEETSCIPEIPTTT